MINNLNIIDESVNNFKKYSWACSSTLNSAATAASRFERNDFGLGSSLTSFEGFFASHFNTRDFQ